MEILDRGFDYRAHTSDPRVVDRNIERAERLDDAVDGLLDLHVISDIATHDLANAACGAHHIGRVPGLLFIDVEENEIRSVLCQPNSDGSPDTNRRTRHQGHLPFQVMHVRSSYEK